MRDEGRDCVKDVNDRWTQDLKAHLGILHRDVRPYKCVVGVFIKLHIITVYSAPVILVILRYSCSSQKRGCVGVDVY